MIVNRTVSQCQRSASSAPPWINIKIKNSFFEPLSFLWSNVNHRTALNYFSLVKIPECKNTTALIWSNSDFNVSLHKRIILFLNSYSYHLKYLFALYKFKVCKKHI